MSSFYIPLENATSLGAFTLVVDLDGTDYRFSFQFNQREGAWYFDILTIDGYAIRSGVKVVSNFPLLRLVRDLVRPPGELVAIDTRLSPSDPALEDLDINSLLSYLDAEGVAAL